MIEPTVGIAIPSIPVREKLLARAVRSVMAQTYPAISQISIAIDHERAGAGATRNRAKSFVDTELIAFLDDDDELKPNHITDLVNFMIETGADVVFPWFDVVGGTDPIAVCEHVEWNDAAPHTVPVTVLMRNDLAQSFDFPTVPEFEGCSNEEWGYFNTLLAHGAKFAKLHKRTWKYHHDSGNTSGLSIREGQPTW